MARQLKNHPGFYLKEAAADDFDRYEDDHGVFQLNSARRSVEDQQDAINRWDRGGWQNRPPYLYEPARPPEASKHVKNDGEAVDIGDWRRFAQNAGDYGFVQTDPAYDVVHFEHPGNGNGGSNGSGLSSEWIRIVQEKLNRMGHGLEADGILGPKTMAAVRHEQSMAGPNGYPGGALTVDGIPGTLTNGYLDWWLVGRHQPSNGYARDSYAEYQAALNKFGYGLVVDDVWGPKSSSALADFQRSRGLTVDRIVGPQTRAALGI